MDIKYIGEHAYISSGALVVGCSDRHDGGGGGGGETKSLNSSSLS
jgi:hypothetical protein